MAGWLLLAGLIAAGAAVALLIAARTARRGAGLPAGRVTYADTGAWRRCERPLFSSRYRLTGRPDYLVAGRRGIIPVEVKPGGTPARPYPAHVLQLAAYCLLVEEQEGRAPPYGILKYAGRTFQVDYTPALRAQLLATLQAMRLDLDAPGVERSHDDDRRCAGCGYRDDCGASL